MCIRDSIEFDLETKINPNEPDATLAPDPFVETLLGVIRDHGMVPRVMIQSFDWRTLEPVSYTHLDVYKRQPVDSMYSGLSR